jgi:hypothetical protein
LARAATAGMMSPGRKIELAAPTSQARADSQPVRPSAVVGDEQWTGLDVPE